MSLKPCHRICTTILMSEQKENVRPFHELFRNDNNFSEFPCKSLKYRKGDVDERNSSPVEK